MIQKTISLKSWMAVLIGPPEACSPMAQGTGTPSVVVSEAKAAPVTAQLIARAASAPSPFFTRRMPIRIPIVLPNNGDGFSGRHPLFQFGRTIIAVQHSDKIAGES